MTSTFVDKAASSSPAAALAGAHSRMGEEIEGVSKTSDGTLDWKGKPALRTTGKWPGSLPMLVLEVAETLTFFGISANLVTYMTAVLHQGVAKSARDVNNWSGTLFLSSVLGAFISDSFWGPYKTIAVTIVIYCLGLSALTISVSLRSLLPQQCPAQDQTCLHPTTGQLAFFFLSIYAIAFSGGSLKANLMSFGADQFDEGFESERKQKHSFFNWFICSIATGGIIAASLLVYIEDRVGWGLGFGILLVGVSLGTAFFVIQTPKYRYRSPKGSPLTRVAQVLVAAFRKRNAIVEADKLHDDLRASTVPRTSQFAFLDKAAVRLNSDVSATPWSVCTVTQVEEVKLVLRVVPIWVSTLCLTLVASQSLTFFVRQGMAMDNRVGSFRVPPGSMFIFALTSQLACLPAYDRVLVPFLRKYTGKERGMTLLQKIGIGMVLNSIGIVVAAVVEMWRRKEARTRQVSIFWLVPQYALLGVGEGLSSAGIFEFFHSQAPDGMGSLGTSFALANVGVGSFMSSLVITCVKSAAPSWLQDNINHGHLDYFYWLLSCLMVGTMVIMYVPLASWYAYKRISIPKNVIM